ncbi:DUF2971 domain-containing protein [Sphingobium sp. sgz301303]
MGGDRAIQILRDQSIRFTQPGQFNDPFELCPTLDVARLKKTYLALLSVRRKKSAGKSEKEILAGLEDYLKSFGRALSAEVGKVGILSLSARCDVPLLWSHYAGSHSGVAIGFRASAGLIGRPPKQSGELFGAGPVDYSTDRYVYPQPGRSAIAYMFRKDICWAYEQEWRIVRPLTDLDEAVPEIFVGRFPKEAVRCVVFGARTPSSIVHEILDIMRSDYPHAHQYRAGQSAEHFEMEIDTFIGDMLRRQDYDLEETFRPNVSTFYNYISEGQLYKAVGMLADDVVFESTADRFDYNP